jgi:hypothetical protein
MKAKIFQLNPFEYWVSYSVEGAIKEAVESSGLPLDCVVDQDGVKEISLKEARNHRFNLSEDEVVTLLDLYNLEGEIPRVLYSSL